MYIYIYMYIHMHTCVCLHICIYIYICVDTCVCVYMSITSHTGMHFLGIMVQSCDTWYAVRTGEHVIYNTCDHFGLECE